MKESRFWLWFLLVVIAVGGGLAILFWGSLALIDAVKDTTSQALQPVSDMTGNLGTQVSQALNPTPTILPDPLTIVHEVRSLARLETIQYSLEKVVTAESGQGALQPLFGDRLLFVAHGVVIAGVDLGRLGPQDIWAKDGILYVQLPQAEIFVATLDNAKSYVYDRDTGLLTKGSVNLETEARRVAEAEIQKSALEDGILQIANQNAESFLYHFLIRLGYRDVIFVSATPEG